MSQWTGRVCWINPGLVVHWILVLVCFPSYAMMYIVHLSEQEIEIARKYAGELEFNDAPSNIRTPDDKLENNKNDQVTGQLGEMALSIYLTGSIDLYVRTREERRKHKYQGDGGTDLLCTRVDAKTSRMRRGSNFIYNLMVRDKEYHEDVCYFLMLIPEDKDDTVLIAGMIHGSQLPESKDGKRTVPMNKLTPIY